MTTQWRWGPVISTLHKHFTRCLVTSLDKPIFSEPTSTWKPRVGCPTVHGGMLVLILSRCDPWDRTDSRKMLLFFYERTKRESVWTDHLGKTNTKHHRSQIKRWEISRLSCPVSQFSFWQADHGSCVFSCREPSIWRIIGNQTSSRINSSWFSSWQTTDKSLSMHKLLSDCYQFLGCRKTSDIFGRH